MFLKRKRLLLHKAKVASQCYNENNLESQIMLEYKEKDHIVWNEILLIFAVFSKMYLKSFSASTYHRNLIVVGNLHSLPFIYFLRTVKQRFSKSTPPLNRIIFPHEFAGIGQLRIYVYLVCYA